MRACDLTYSDLSADLASLHREYAMVLEQELRAKVNGYFQSDGSLRDREWNAKASALEPSCEAIKIRGEIEAIKVQLDALRFADDASVPAQ